MDYYGDNDYRDYLAHYGKKGMKWGKKKKPGVLEKLADERRYERAKNNMLKAGTQLVMNRNKPVTKKLIDGRVQRVDNKEREKDARRLEGNWRRNQDLLRTTEQGKKDQKAENRKRKADNFFRRFKNEKAKSTGYKPKTTKKKSAWYSFSNK
jgi:hypothetical protein